MIGHAPILCEWTGEAMVPVGPAWARRADQQYVIGERYPVEIHHERSQASHRAYFAAIKEAWDNLPETEMERFPTPEHLRKYALVRAGYRDERTIVASSKAEAQRIAAFIKPMDEHAVVVVRDAVVVVWTPQSQSYRAMGKQEFQASKDKVLDVIAGLVGVSVAELEHNVGRAA